MKNEKKQNLRARVEGQIKWSLTCAERGRELLAFIEREPVVQWLVSRFEQASPKIHCDAIIGDYPAPVYILLDYEEEKGGLSQTALLAFDYLWIDKNMSDERCLDDRRQMASILRRFPDEGKPVFLGYKPCWEAIMETVLNYKHVQQSISALTDRLVQVPFVHEEELYSICATETERVLITAQDSDDFFVTEGCVVPFERVRAEVLEQGLTVSKKLIGLQSKLAVDFDVKMRHDKWLAEYEELTKKNGPTIIINPYTKRESKSRKPS